MWNESGTWGEELEEDKQGIAVLHLKRTNLRRTTQQATSVQKSHYVIDNKDMDYGHCVFICTK